MNIPGTSLPTAGVDLTSAEEEVYRLLVDLTSASATDLIARGRHEPAEIRAALHTLQRTGLVNRTAAVPPHYVAVPPDWALDALLVAEQRHLEHTRRQAAKLAALHQSVRRDQRAGELGEIIVGSDRISSRFRQLQIQARHEIRAFVMPPFLTDDDGHNEVRTTQSEQLSAGVRYRVVYDEAGFSVQGGLEAMLSDIAAGEDVRIADRLPVKLFLVDRSTALLPMANRTDEPTALVVHQDDILAALGSLFEQVWEHATIFAGTAPTAPNHSTVLAEGSRQLFTLLRAGFTEVTIARQLGLSTRTLQRRIRALMTEAGAETRFQLGIRAVELGWIETPLGPATDLPHQSAAPRDHDAPPPTDQSNHTTPASYFDLKKSPRGGA